MQHLEIIQICRDSAGTQAVLFLFLALVPTLRVSWAVGLGVGTLDLVLE